MAGTPRRLWAALLLAAALLGPAAAREVPPDPGASLLAAVERLRSSYLEGLPVETAEPADERAALDALVRAGAAPLAAAARYQAAMAELDRAREVQEGRPQALPSSDFDGWLGDVARGFGLDEEQSRAAEALYRGRLRAPAGAPPVPAAAPAAGVDRLDATHGAALIGGARRVADAFSARPPGDLPEPLPGGPLPPAGGLTAADFARLNAVPEAQAGVSLRTGPVPAPRGSHGPTNGASARDSLPIVLAVTEDIRHPPVGVDLGAPTPAPGYDFRGRKADAERYTATFADGTRVSIVVPRDRVPGWQGRALRAAGLQDTAVEASQRNDWLGRAARYVTGVAGPDSQNYTARQVAATASYLPESSRRDIRTIVVNDVRNPQDAYWEQAYHMKGFRSYMTSSANGTVWIYPADRSETLADGRRMRVSLLHEAGHVFSLSRWGTPNEKALNAPWARWKAAAAGDGAYVSQYAKVALVEDFAETFAAYHSSQGSPRFDDFKARVPRRFDILGRTK